MILTNGHKVLFAICLISIVADGILIYVIKRGYE